MIRVEGLVKSFRGYSVLRGLDLEVPTGSITIVIGRSGGGKSVLLRHLIGLLRPDDPVYVVPYGIETPPPAPRPPRPPGAPLRCGVIGS